MDTNIENLPPPPPTLRILLKCVSGAESFLIFGHMLIGCALTHFCSCSLCNFKYLIRLAHYASQLCAVLHVVSGYYRSTHRYIGLNNPSQIIAAAVGRL